MKLTFPICPIIDLSDFSDVLLLLISCWILTDYAMNLCLGRCTVSVLNLKWHPRIIFVFDNPSSAANLSVKWRDGNSRPGVPLEDYLKLLHLKSQSYKQLKNYKTNQVHPCAHVLPVACGKRISNTRESLGNIVKSLSNIEISLS